MSLLNRNYIHKLY